MYLGFCTLTVPFERKPSFFWFEDPSFWPSHSLQSKDDERP